MNALEKNLSALAKRDGEISASLLQPLLEEEDDKEMATARLSGYCRIAIELLHDGRQIPFPADRLRALLKSENWHERQSAGEILGSFYAVEKIAICRTSRSVWDRTDPANLFPAYLAVTALTTGVPADSLPEAYENFLGRFRAMNSALSEERRIEERSFFQKHTPCLVFLIQIMGKDTFSMLKGLIGSNPFPLRRFFRTLEIKDIPPELAGPLGAFYAAPPKKDLPSFQKTLELLPAYMEQDKLPLFLEKLAQGKDRDGKGLYTDLAETYLQGIIQTLNIPIERVPVSVLQRFPIKYLPRLLVSMNFIQTRHPRRAAEYRAFLEAAIEGRFQDYMTDVTQTEPTGRRWAAHNANVRDAIKQAGPDLATWLQYREEVSFGFSGTEQPTELRPETAVTGLTQFLALLKNRLAASHPQYKTTLDNLFTKQGIRILDGYEDDNPARVITSEGELRQDQQKVARQFSDANFLQRLNQALTHIRIKTKENILLQEILGHVKQSLDGWVDFMKKPAFARAMAAKKRNFSIRMWQRDPAHDLFLGDITGCCMASNNDRFDAILDHLLDQGIQVAEVIDEETGETMALAWLFIAVDDAGNAHLVIDNIEVAPNYRFDALKEKIQKELVAYCRGLGSVLGAKSLLAGHFSYGPCHHEKGKKPIPMRLKKLGGYAEEYRPYYLESLEHDSFYVMAEQLPKRPYARPVAAMSGADAAVDMAL